MKPAGRPLARRLERAWGLAAAAVLLARSGPIRTAPRSLPERLADLPLRDLPLERPVTIRWDAHHIPFIEAESEVDLATALGSVHMHLRATQIEVLRRISQGRLSEMVGPLGVPIDHTVRTIGFGEAAPAIEAMLPERSRAWLDAFLRGFNAHGAAAKPAPEWAALGLAREPWTARDFFTMSRLMSADLTWPVLRRLLALRDALPAAEWRQLWPQILRGGSPDLPLPSGDAADLFGAATRAGAGSNAAALAGTRTASGRAAVGGDPHLGLNLPTPWLAASLHAPGLHAAGLMLPGIPFLALGRNADIAWGGTSLHAASTDFVDLAGVADADIAERTETVHVRGGQPRRVRIRSTAWGPVVSDTALFPSDTPLAMAWVGHRPSDELSAMLGLLTARDADDFRRTLRPFAIPGQTMVYGGPDGVGRQAAAHLPRRPPGAPADLLVECHDADVAWRTLADGGELFGEWDPPGGAVASANERLAPAAPAHIPVGLFFASDARVDRIRTLLDRSRGVLDSGAAMRELVHDVGAPSSLPQRDLLARHLPRPLRPPHVSLAAALRAWDGRYDAGSTGALAFEALLGETARRLLGATALARLESLSATRALVADRLHAAEPRALATAVAAALPLAARRFRRLGTWGGAHRHRPQHPLGALPGALGRPFRERSFPGFGGNDTLNKTGHALLRGRHRIGFGATARYVFDLADLDANAVVLFGGQDGWLGSSTMADQIPLWRAERMITLPLRPETARRTHTLVTVLRPD